MRPTFSLAYTSARHSSIALVLLDWILKAQEPRAVEICLCVDSTNPQAESVARSIHGIKLALQTKPDPDCVTGWNLAAGQSTGQVIIAISDDFVPMPGWDTKILKAGPEDWIDLPRVMRVNDGHLNAMCTLPIVTRPRYQQFGYLFFPQYKSMFCDTDLTELAYRDGVVIEAPQLVFTHKHWDNRLRPQDDVDKRHCAEDRWELGRRIFFERRMSWYPGYRGPLLFKDPIDIDDLRGHFKCR